MAACNRDFKDGTLWFMAREGSPKLDELAESKNVLLGLLASGQAGLCLAVRHGAGRA